ncbi:MAG: hypothetical protein GX242_01510 [Clostridiales bacterium]|nr:hypothetical protein [Clostridiales bacterium]
MILKDIIEKAIDIVCDDDIDVDVPSPKLNKLIRCANMIYQELTEEYVQLKECSEIEFNDGKAYFHSFPKLVKDIISVSKMGIKQDFTVYPNFVCSSVKGTAEVTYTYHPSDLKLEEEVILPPNISCSALAVGTASEYFYRSGLIDEANFYKNRYDTTIINLTRHTKPIELKVRRFL